MRDPSPAASTLAVEIAGRRWQVAANGHDISIPLRFNEAQPTFFGAPAASAAPITAGAFVGDVRQGGSCNCAVHTLTPHCNGTHTECVGHITQERLSVRDLAIRHLSAALLISVTPEPSAQMPGDRVISLATLRKAIGNATLSDYQALVVRTLPNDSAKLTCNYDAGPMPPYFTSEAMRSHCRARHRYIGRGFTLRRSSPRWRQAGGSQGFLGHASRQHVRSDSHAPARNHYGDGIHRRRRRRWSISAEPCRSRPSSSTPRRAGPFCYLCHPHERFRRAHLRRTAGCRRFTGATACRVFHSAARARRRQHLSVRSLAWPAAARRRASAQ